MKCHGCVESISNALKPLSGLSNLTVDLSSKSVSFEATDQNAVDMARHALQTAGFPVDE